jgi:hypothetical protein
MLYVAIAINGFIVFLAFAFSYSEFVLHKNPLAALASCFGKKKTIDAESFEDGEGEEYNGYTEDNGDY